MELDKILFLPSVQHTGTWFVLRTLERFGYNAVDCWRLLGGGVNINDPSTIQTHFPIEQAYGVPFEEDKWMNVNSIQVLSKIFKTIIPVRDPLAAILTREARHPELRHFYIVDGFVSMAEKMSGNSNVVFFPIDLNPDPNARKELLSKLLTHVGVEETKNVTVEMNSIASTWTVQNETPGNRFKKAYQNKDKEEVTFLLGSKIAEVDYLKNKASIILPFLASIGYTKEDLDLW
jgi:hypothetical protein|tara:strand:- start:879 stop:1577 length:699 start_codon:yes stop_codon:yes gene_type:complete